MQEHLSKLVSLLEHKTYLLNRLIRKQEDFKDFLMRPQWEQLPSIMQPQEDLMLKLRQVQSAQDYLLSELARAANVAQIPNLKSLCTLIEPEWQRLVLDYIDKLEDAVARLRGITQTTQALNQAEWRFNRELLQGRVAPKALNVYNAQGYTQQAAFGYHSVSREI